MKDRRILKTKKAIRTAFLRLLQEKEVNKIAVSELSELADLGRGTFYLYYKDIYDLMNQMEKEILEDIGVLFDQALLGEAPSDFSRFMEDTLKYIEENKEVFLLLLSEKGSVSFLERLKAFFRIKELEERKRYNQSIDTEFDQYEVTFLISGVVGVIQDWVQGGMQQSPKHMTLSMERIFRNNGVD